MKRSDLQAMAEAALEDATVLFQNGRFSNAFYLAGYAVEFALKAVIAKQIQAETIPERALINDFWTHDLEKLVVVARCSESMKERKRISGDFAANWAVVAEWSPNARYAFKDAAAARELLFAVGDPFSGVLPWIKTFW